MGYGDITYGQGAYGVDSITPSPPPPPPPPPPSPGNPPGPDPVVFVLPPPIPFTVSTATDIAQTFSEINFNFDFTLDVTGQQLASDKDLVTSITNSLFCDRLALTSDELPELFDKDRRGWWADPYLIADQQVGQRIGSRLWLLTRSKSTQALLPVAKGYVQEALQWLIDKKVASTLTIDTSFIFGQVDKLQIVIVVVRPGKNPLSLNFKFAWDQVAGS